MTTIAERCDALALEAGRLRTDVEFRVSLTHARGQLTMAHVSLHSAMLSARRALAAIEATAAEADSFLAEGQRVA